MSKTMPARGLAAAALLGALASLSLPAAAQVHKCTQADGSVAYQATPCVADGPPPARVTAAQLNAAQRARERARARAASAPQSSGANAHPHEPAGSKPRPCRTRSASPPLEAGSAAARSSASTRPC